MKRTTAIACLIVFALLTVTTIGLAAKRQKAKLLPPPETTTRMVTVLPNSTIAIVWIMDNETLKIKEDSQIKFHQWIAEEAMLGVLLMSLQAFEAEALYEEVGLMINGPDSFYSKNGR